MNDPTNEACWHKQFSFLSVTCGSLFFSHYFPSVYKEGLLELLESNGAYQEIEMQLVDLDSEREENDDFIFEGDMEEEINKYELYLVGRFLTEKNINERAMKTKMTDVWKPTMEINIKEFETDIYMFQFYSIIRRIFSGFSMKAHGLLIMLC